MRAVLFLLCGTLAAQYPPAPPQDTSGFGAGVRRTMTLLAASTPQKRNTVRILFYGQSITKQDWWKLVAADLRERFPHADVVAANRAPGGFATPLLRRTLDANVFPFYPDLLIFHDYGNEEDYEWMVREIRQRTTAEILLQTDHVTWLPGEGERNEAEEKKLAWQDRHSYHWLRDLAQKYGLEWGDVRRPWREYLETHKLPPKALLRDSVHLNAHGDWLMAELMKRHLRHIPGAPADARRDLVRVYTPGKDAAWAGNRLELEFEGNRVEAIAASEWRRPGTRARFLIDGKPPSDLPELRVHGKMTDTWGPDWPVAIRVSAQAPLLLEDWTLTIFEAGPDGKRFRFRVEGSRTGPDGEGLSAERFVSKSGRVLIESEDWHVARARDLRKESMPLPYVARWSVLGLFADQFVTPSTDDLTHESVLVVASGLANKRHKLEILYDGPEPPAILGLRIYRPSHVIN